jgi:hypothetical protein
MKAYTVEVYCEIDKKWCAVYRNGKGALFSSRSGATAYLTRQAKHGDKGNRYRVNTYQLELEKTEIVCQ